MVEVCARWCIFTLADTKLVRGCLPGLNRDGHDIKRLQHPFKISRSVFGFRHEHDEDDKRHTTLYTCYTSLYSNYRHRLHTFFWKPPLSAKIEWFYSNTPQISPLPPNTNTFPLWYPSVLPSLPTPIPSRYDIPPSPPRLRRHHVNAQVNQ